MKYVLFLGFLAALGACSSAKSVKIKPVLLHGTWKVASIATSERLTTGVEMGDPLYTFTAQGYRIKSYLQPPHSDSMPYLLKGDSISYPENPKIPAVKIQKLSQDSLVLESPSALWRLYR